MNTRRRLEVEPKIDAAWAGWIGKISQGDEASLSELYAAAASRVYGLALRITHTPCMAEEVVEEVFFQVWRTSASFDLQRGRPLAWLLVICRSLALKKIRSIGPRIAFEDMGTLSERPGEAAIDPQSLLLAMEQNTLLHNALEALDPLERQLLGLAFFQGCSYSEVACQMAMPLGTVKSNMRHALQILRKRLAFMYEGKQP